MSQVSDQATSSAPASPQFAATLQRAVVYAEEQAHRLVTTEHLLLALTEDPDSLVVLRRKTVDIDHLRNEVAGLVSRNFDRFAHGDAGQPIYGADLLRVLNTASGAASSRRPIDGALVLAAVIADGRTPAAELIKLYGLTFEDAARATRSPPVASGAPLHPPLGTVRAAARDSALGLRKQTRQPEADDGSDEPLTLPLPPQPPAQAQARGATSLRRSPASYAEPDRPVPPNNGPVGGQQAYNGHGPNGWDQQYAPGPGQPAYDPSPPQSWPPQSLPTQSLPTQSLPPESLEPANSDWSNYAYPEVEPRWEGEPQDPYAEALPAQAQAPQRRDRRADAQSAPSADTGKTRGRKAGGKSRRKPDRPPIIENIPRQLRLGAPVMAEARIARRDIEAALAEFNGTGLEDGRGGAFARTAMMRLRAADHCAQIETNSPETVWIDGSFGLIDDEYVSWRWTLTGNYSGRGHVQLIASVRAVGEAGASPEIALYDQTIDIRVARNLPAIAGQAAKWLGFVAGAMALGALGEHMLHVITRLTGWH